MSPPLSRTASAFGARMRNVTRPVRGHFRRDHLRPRRAADSRGLSRRPLRRRGSPGPAPPTVFDGRNGDDRSSSVHCFSPSRRPWTLHIIGAGGVARSARARRDRLRLRHRLGNSGKKLHEGLCFLRPKGGQQPLPAPARSAPEPLVDLPALAGQRDAAGTAVGGMLSRVTKPRLSSSRSMARIVLASEEARRTSSCWVIPSSRASRARRTN